MTRWAVVIRSYRVLVVTLDGQPFFILLLHFITASDLRSRCFRFLLCKFLVLSSIIDFLRKSLQEEIFEAFFWVFCNKFFAQVSAGSNISCSSRALYFWSCERVTARSNVLGSFSAFCYKFCEQVTTGANVWRFLVYHIKLKKIFASNPEKRTQNKHKKTWMRRTDTKWTIRYFQQCACVNAIYFAPLVTTTYRMKSKSSTRGLSFEMSVLARARAQLLNMLYISTRLSLPHGENV